jgi:hypothetical protein
MGTTQRGRHTTRAAPWRRHPCRTYSRFYKDLELRAVRARCSDNEECRKGTSSRFGASGGGPCPSTVTDFANPFFPLGTNQAKGQPSAEGVPPIQPRCRRRGAPSLDSGRAPSSGGAIRDSLSSAYLDTFHAQPMDKLKIEQLAYAVMPGSRLRSVTVVPRPLRARSWGFPTSSELSPAMKQGTLRSRTRAKLVDTGRGA